MTKIDPTSTKTKVSFRLLALFAVFGLAANPLLTVQAFRVDPALESSNGQSEAPLLFDSPKDAQEENSQEDCDNQEDCLTSVDSIATPLEEHVPISPLLKGSVEKTFEPDVEFEPAFTVAKGETLILTMLDFLATGYNMPGDTFNAVVKQPVKQGGKTVIPAGSLVRGHIEGAGDTAHSNAHKSRIELVFDYILLPNGQKIPLSSSYNKKSSVLKAAAKRAAGGIGGTLTGAVKGVLVGLQFGGIEGAYLSNGFTLIAGGGIGAIAGLGKGLARTNDDVVLNEGDSIKVKLEQPLALPDTSGDPSDVAQEFATEGLHMTVTDMKMVLDPFQVQNQIELNLSIDNETEYEFGQFDFVLEDSFGAVHQVSPFHKNAISFKTVPAHDHFEGSFLFSVNNPQFSHFLVVYKPYTREVLAKVSLNEAYKKLTESSAPDKTSGKSGHKPSSSRKKRDAQDS